MPKQRVPDIDFEFWVVAELPDLFTSCKIHINKEYQRGDIWTYNQKLELIRSMNNRYSIGVIVLFINDDNKFEILKPKLKKMAIKYSNSNSIKNIGMSDEPKYGKSNAIDLVCGGHRHTAYRYGNWGIKNERKNWSYCFKY